MSKKKKIFHIYTNWKKKTLRKKGDRRKLSCNREVRYKTRNVLIPFIFDMWGWSRSDRFIVLSTYYMPGTILNTLQVLYKETALLRLKGVKERSKVTWIESWFASQAKRNIMKIQEIKNKLKVLEEQEESQCCQRMVCGTKWGEAGRPAGKLLLTSPVEEWRLHVPKHLSFKVVKQR